MSKGVQEDIEPEQGNVPAVKVKAIGMVGTVGVVGAMGMAGTSSQDGVGSQNWFGIKILFQP